MRKFLESIEVIRGTGAKNLLFQSTYVTAFARRTRDGNEKTFLALVALASLSIHNEQKLFDLQSKGMLVPVDAEFLI